MSDELDNASSQPETAPHSRWRRLMPAAILLTAATALGAVMWSSGAGDAPIIPVKLVQSYPHDPSSFVQGLIVHNGQLMEGTGHYGESRLRTVDLETGRPIVDRALNGNEFGEGICVWDNTILQLTWKAGYIILWDAKTMKRTGYVRLSDIDRRLKQGWGITHDGTHLIISDGSADLRFVDPKTFRMVRRLRIRDGSRSVSNLNELEFVNGQVFANIWYKDLIAQIDPKTGRVKGWLDLRPVRPAAVRGQREAVLNGIAYDKQKKRLFVTGKNWPLLHEIRF